ncbi:hypothetical protein PAXRUDRAFT_131353 [Paxillus rubicundulus Ve08.2h10]|uniref:Tc1-like transposase DDE domain-containing protein n=1 Tax=Paxillus rubicundulus Ve08.2h10 TaxID=930991 RepID=A0A0D0DWI6_9AGAM|nr:hypothetical protein PAXRUDRAFT_131353 [Paxillus rubicundulus Ve08.2h10]
MVWPAQSPDLNPMKHTWGYLKRRLAEHEHLEQQYYQHPPNGMEQLWERIEVDWNKVPASVCQGLIESMSRRIEAVLKAKGGYTKY